jgi:hypothetical protein
VNSESTNIIISYTFFPNPHAQLALSSIKEIAIAFTTLPILTMGCMNSKPEVPKENPLTTSGEDIAKVSQS